MANTNNSALTEQKKTNLAAVKSYMNTVELKERFEAILGQKAAQFMASVTNAVSTTPKLQECDAASVIQSALIAATYDLPIDGNLGFAAIVPYQSKAQFQMMYKGYIQLAIRSGEYADMNVSEVYADEIKSYNPITGQVTFVDDFTETKMREEGNPENIVGYFAWFKLLKGFSHALYMTKKEVDNHARRYSTAYQYDLSKGRNTSRWSQDFDAMGKKTVIKLLLSKWGILSIDMRRAIEDDQKVVDGDGNALYLDNPETKEREAVVDVFAEAEAAADERKAEKEEPLAELNEFPESWDDAEGGKLPWD